MSKSILPGPVAGQRQAGARRALRLAALVPVVAGSFSLLTANVVRAEDVPTEPTTTEPTVPTTEPTVPTTEPTVPTTEPTVPTTEPTVPTTPVVSDAPAISSVLARPGGLTVSFLPAEDSHPLVYIVAAYVGDTLKSVEVVPGDVTKASLSGLANGTEYDVKVSAISLLGFTQVSEIVKATPLADGAAVAPAHAVQNLEVVRSKSSATASWDAPANDGGAPVKAYVMNVIDESTGGLVVWRTLPADVRTASVAPLRNGVAYTVNVFPVTSFGFGAVEAVEHVLGSTGLDNPVAPTLPWASAYVDEDGKVAANWGAAAEQGVPALGYNAVIVQDDEIVGWNVVDAAGRSVQVAGRDATKPAEVYVFASSLIGWGVPQIIELPADVVPAT